MTGLLDHILAPLAVLAGLVFLMFRMRFLSPAPVPGRGAFLTGSVLIVAASFWQTVRWTTDYSQWFVSDAYAMIDTAQFVVFAFGGLLLVVALALYSDHWQERGRELSAREQRLSLLDNLERDAREPYQLLQLLEIYPFERNQISQAIDIGEPLVFGRLELFDQHGQAVSSRFESCLVLPLISGLERVGAIVLATTEARRLGRSEVRFLAPVATWLAEKIKSARLTREAALAKDEARRQLETRTDLATRLAAASKALQAGGQIDPFCRSLVGMFEAGSVHLVGMADGPLEIHGGSEPLDDVSENYRTALIDALGRGRPLIVNQEATSESGSTYISMSTLVFPLDGGKRHEALLFRREASAFSVDQSDLKSIGIFAGLAAVVLRQEEVARRDLTRRKGFRRVLEMLRFADQASLEAKPSFLVEHLSQILPSGSASIVFSRQTDGSLKASEGHGFATSLLADFHLLPGEGFVGETVHGREPQSIIGRARVDRAVRSLEMNNREALYRIFGEKGPPSLAIVCPLTSLEIVNGVVMIFIDDCSEAERGEWERLLTLAVGLYSFRQTIAELHQSLTPVPVSGADRDVFGSVLNKINNQISAIIGNAELAAARPDLEGDVKRHIEAIIDEAQHVADYARDLLGGQKSSAASPVTEKLADLNQCLRDLLDHSRISGNLYMLGGKPREVEPKLRSIVAPAVGGKTLAHLAEGAINQFARLVREDEILTLSTYRLNDYVYLDISRHSRDLPAVERLEGLADYVSPLEAAPRRPNEQYLAETAQADYGYARDDRSDPPTYLSFKFPATADIKEPTPTRPPRPRILAVDDQTVILDLITAMGQSQGYEVVTSSDPWRGLDLGLSQSFNVVLVDLAMPGLSGLDLAARIRERRPEVPIILLTGWEVAVNQQQLDRAGISEILNKPFRIEQLTDLLRSAIPRNSLS